MTIDPDDFRQGIERLLEELQGTPFRACVLGPGKGNKFGFGKRSAICAELTRMNIECIIPEDVDPTLPQDVREMVPVPDRELQLMRSSDCIVVLETERAGGTKAELAQIHSEGLNNRAVVLYPYEYLPIPLPPESELSYIATIIRSMLHTIPYTQAAYQDCSLIADCVAKVRNLRWAKFRRSRGGF